MMYAYRNVQQHLSFGTLAFAQLRDDPQSAHEAVLRNVWAKTPDQEIDTLQNGDQIVIYAANHFDAVQEQKDNEAYLTDSWKNIQDMEILDGFDMLSQTGREIFEKDRDDFFYRAGFLKIASKHVPNQWKKTAPPPVIITEYDVSIVEDADTFNVKNPEFALVNRQQFIAQRSDILYSGIVDMDDKTYTRTMHVNDLQEDVSFTGLQKGFTADAWATLVYFGHEILVIRPQPGIA